MITASGVLFMSKTAPLVTTARDGTFCLTLLAYDRFSALGVEPWRITWSGAQAQEFWDKHRAALKPSQPIAVVVERIRAFTRGQYSAAESHCMATSIQLAPFAHEIARKPSFVMRDVLSKTEQSQSV